MMLQAGWEPELPVAVPVVVHVVPSFEVSIFQFCEPVLET